jgi:hypothetical protein
MLAFFVNLFAPFTAPFAILLAVFGPRTAANLPPGAPS